MNINKLIKCIKSDNWKEQTKYILEKIKKDSNE